MGVLSFLTFVYARLPKWVRLPRDTYINSNKKLLNSFCPVFDAVAVYMTLTELIERKCPLSLHLFMHDCRMDETPEGYVHKFEQEAFEFILSSV
ncbi:hypothetical protein B4W73_03465 [Staphylococcus delphini]|nr:hypothetical protein B4W73_03465 [Staphylococcus delphini]